MKIIKTFKYAGLVALVLGVAIGCAGTPTQEQAGAEQTQAVTAADAQAAIDQAKAALSKAQAAGAAWRDTDGIIKQAEDLMKKGDYEGAKRMADMARTQAENALEQKKREEARLAAQMQTEMPSKMDQYVVKAGDSLWRISGMDEIYGNPYEWPLIYKANQDKIHDADLIYPGQQFAIDRNASAADIDAAVNHAKTRGAWSLGVVEESDRAYLGK
jgi:nucleoid-associated protein YgaU